MSVLVRLGLVLATAALFGLSFPPYGPPGVAWVALVPLFLALRGLGPRAALLTGWASGLLMAYAITDFLPASVATYYGQGPVFGAFLFIASVTAMCCSSHMIFCLWYRSPARTEGFLSSLLVGAAWVVAKLVIWPENAVTFFIAEEPLYRHANVLAVGASLIGRRVRNRFLQ